MRRVDLFAQFAVAASEMALEDAGRLEVDPALAGLPEDRDRLLRLRRQRVGPPQEAFGVGHPRSGIGGIGGIGIGGVGVGGVGATRGTENGSRSTLEVSVEQPGQRRHATAVDRGQGGDHRRHREPGDVAVSRRGQLGGQLGVRLLRSGAPGAAGVVTELVRPGGQDAMGHPASRHDLALFVHSQGLH